VVAPYLHTDVCLLTQLCLDLFELCKNLCVNKKNVKIWKQRIEIDSCSIALLVNQWYYHLSQSPFWSRTWDRIYLVLCGLPTHVISWPTCKILAYLYYSKDWTPLIFRRHLIDYIINLLVRDCHSKIRNILAPLWGFLVVRNIVKLIHLNYSLLEKLKHCRLT
jgi:hypothetical protein